MAPPRVTRRDGLINSDLARRQPSDPGRATVETGARCRSAEGGQGCGSAGPAFKGACFGAVSSGSVELTGTVLMHAAT